MAHWRQRQLKMVESRQDLVVNSATRRMEKILKKAVEDVWENYERGNTFHPPNLNEMFSASEQFYRDIITAAFICTETSKDMQRPGRKRLAKLPFGLPRTLKELEHVFRDQKYWPKIMKRSKKLTEKLRKAFTDKLKKRFDKLVPRLLSNEITTAEAKEELMKSWRTSRSRVETIFRTETTNYFSRTQLAFFNGDDDIIGFMFDAIRDAATTDICRKRHGLVYRPGSEELRQNTPALHFNCRSHLIPLANTPENQKLLKDPSRNPKNRSVPPLPPGWRK